MVTTLVNSPSNDVVELKQVALWHGDRQRINRANEAAAEGIAECFAVLPFQKTGRLKKQRI